MIRVTAAIIEKNRKYLIAQRKKGQHLELKWEFPGGKIEQDESAKECLSREIFEEFDLKCKVEDYLGSITYSDEEYSIELIAYKVLLDSTDFKLKVHEKIKWVSLQEINKMNLAPADIILIKKINQKLNTDCSSNRYNNIKKT